MKQIMSIISALILSLCVTSAQAFECVLVQNRGFVSLNHLLCVEVLNNGGIQKICYDTRNSYLIVRRDRYYYDYCGVSALFINELIKAPSKSKYIDTHIQKDIFDCSVFLPPDYTKGKCR